MIYNIFTRKIPSNKGTVKGRITSASWDQSVKIVGLWEKAVPNPKPESRPGQVSIWGSQLGMEGNLSHRILKIKSH